MSMFRKPKRNVRQRQVDSDEEEADSKNGGNSAPSALSATGNDNDDVLANIAKFKESKKKSGNKKKLMASSTEGKEDKKKSLLSFDDFDAEADDGEVFRVKKSSQSRRLMKQKKAEKKFREQQKDPPLPPPGEEETPLPPPPPSIPPPPPTIDEEELGIRVKNNLNVKPRDDVDEMRTLSGYEAEALHMEEEDLSDEDEDKSDGEDSKDPLQSILQSGAIPDAAAIYAARKRRQAARERGENGPRSKDYISLKKNRDHEEEEGDKEGEREQRQDDDSGDDDARITMTGIRSRDALRKQKLEAAETHHVVDEDDHDTWEEQQIRKAMKSNRIGGGGGGSVSPPDFDSGYADPRQDTFAKTRDQQPQHPALVSYNLEGIKDRIKKRLTSLDEVNRRHNSDADKIVDELVASQTAIEEKQRKLPEVIDRHHFYQDLRGYVTDLVECFDEKLANIKYVEEKYHKSKAEVFQKIVERRRQDVRDQMRELSSNNAKPLQTTAEESQEEFARQERAREREGRRRRRAQLRLAKAGQMPPHNDGMSSDDELPPFQKSSVAKIRKDVENEARTIMADVVDEFSTVDGVLFRMEKWKATDSNAYSDAYVSLCLPKIVAPLVRLQLLFWNPLEEHTNVEDMSWYKTLAMYSASEADLDKDPDRKLLSLVIEKVVLAKINSLTKAAYDPMSTAQSLKLTQLLLKLKNTYPTLTGDSKQVRELLNTVMERLKSTVDQDVYIPLGYSKQYLENPASGHALFLNRQFWGCFRLFKNVFCWHGLLADNILMDLALNSMLYRYLLIGLGVNPNPVDSVNKCRHIVAALPSEWLSSGRMTKELTRFANYMSKTLGQIVNLPRESIRDIVKLLKVIGATEASETLERERLLR